MEEIHDNLPPDDDFTGLPDDDEGLQQRPKAKKQKCLPYKNAKAPMTEKLMRTLKVPLPLKLDQLKQKFGSRANMLLIEVFSPPRLQTYCITTHIIDQEKLLSIDITTGWDLSLPSVRTFLLSCLPLWTPKCIMMSPPCTSFSQLQTGKSKR